MMGTQHPWATARYAFDRLALFMDMHTWPIHVSSDPAWSDSNLVPLKCSFIQDQVQERPRNLFVWGTFGRWAPDASVGILVSHVWSLRIYVKEWMSIVISGTVSREVEREFWRVQMPKEEKRMREYFDFVRDSNKIKIFAHALYLELRDTTIDSREKSLC